MIEIEETNLQEGVEYFIEYSDNNENTRKLQGTFVKNETYSSDPSHDIITSYFNNVHEVNPNKNCFSIEMAFTQPTNNAYHWTFYQISQPTIYQKSIDRLYENAIQIQLRNITGDPYFIFQ